MIKSKRGWIRLVEVFIAILLLTGVLLIIANKSNTPDKDKLAIEIYQKEIAMLRNIELNYTLRTEILNAAPLPVEWEDFDSAIPNVWDKIVYLTPQNLECKAKICLMNQICTTDGLSGGDIYAKSVIISANIDTYSPRELKLFCKTKLN
jgi:hypothetical protein